MPRKSNILVHSDDAEKFKTPEALAEHLATCLAANDIPLFLTVLGIAARHRGMSAVAAHAGVTRAALYTALAENGNPRFDTIHKVLTFLGVRLTINVA